jgi:hypothetical protein
LRIKLAFIPLTEIFYLATPAAAHTGNNPVTAYLNWVSENRNQTSQDREEREIYRDRKFLKLWRAMILENG